MEKAKVYFSDLRTSPTSNLLDKMERLLKRAGIGQLPLKDSFTAIKIHFGEPGNLAYIRPNYAARMANLLRSFGAKPFLTDCNTLYSGRRSNAVDHLQSAMENGFNPISAQCQVIIADGLKGTDYREIPIDGEYCPAPKIGTAIADADIIISMNHFKVLIYISTLENHRKGWSREIPEPVFSIYLTILFPLLSKQKPKTYLYRLLLLPCC